MKTDSKLLPETELSGLSATGMASFKLLKNMSGNQV